MMLLRSMAPRGPISSNLRSCQRGGGPPALSYNQEACGERETVSAGFLSSVRVLLEERISEISSLETCWRPLEVIQSDDSLKLSVWLRSGF